MQKPLGGAANLFGRWKSALQDEERRQTQMVGAGQMGQDQLGHVVLGVREFSHDLLNDILPGCAPKDYRIPVAHHVPDAVLHLRG